MGTLTKKLHVLKSGGTEEACNIYTTPEEVGGSPYLALEVDGQKGYVKLGSTTDANATHLRVKKNGITYAAQKQAEVAVPTGSISINRNGTFTVPSGVHVIMVTCEADTVYVGVTPNTTHYIDTYIDQDEYLENFRWLVECSTHSEIYIDNNSVGDDGIVDIYWSPEINKKTPTVKDY